MTNEELKEMCANAAESYLDYTTDGKELANIIRAIRLPVEQEPIAFLWVMDNTEKIKENKPLKAFTFNGKENPFGTPGEDYSKEYPVTCTHLYDAPPSVEALEKQVAELKQLINDDGYAASFQSLGQYRSALLKELSK